LSLLHDASTNEKERKRKERFREMENECFIVKVLMINVFVHGNKSITAIQISIVQKPFQCASSSLNKLPVQNNHFFSQWLKPVSE